MIVTKHRQFPTLFVEQYKIDPHYRIVSLRVPKSMWSNLSKKNTIMEDNENHTPRRKPRKIMKVTPSKFEATEALHTNKNYWGNIFARMDSTDILEESQKFASVLPKELYKKVCSILDLPMINNVYEDTQTIEAHIPRRMIKEPMLSYRKCIYIDRELDSDTDVEIHSSEEDEEKTNIHKEFLSKPEREQVTWATRYLQPEKEEEKSLIKKADDLTDRIAKEFCEYMKELGGSQQSDLFTPKTIKELFQIEFDTHVSRSLRVVIKELPSVEEQIANVTGNPEKSRYAMLEREISKDIKAENKADCTQAFSRSLPLKDQYRAPKNNTRKLWRSARHVPKDLVTLKAVWEGITNLRSVNDYCRWMIDHPEHRKPPYLNSLGMFDPAVLDAKQLESKHHYTPSVDTHETRPAPIEDIRRRLSQLADSS